MKIHVIAVGKLKEKFWVEACAEYMKRLKAYAKVTIEEIPDRDPAKCGGEEGARKTEGKGILEALPEHSHVILLDVGGKQLSSEELAQKIADAAQRGAGDMAFVIGSSHGLSARVKQAASIKLSMSKMTFPHQLMRVILLEQIYRGYRITAGEPYHK